MIKVEKEFKGKGEVSGINFSQVKREGLWCLYKRSDGYYEVVKLQERQAGIGYFSGVKVEFKERESYPTGESWSLNGHGACVRSLEKANAIFKQKVYE